MVSYKPMEESCHLNPLAEARREAVMERRWRIAVFALSLAGCAAPLGFASAQSGITQRLFSTILFVIAKILEVIIYFIGKLVILVVDCIIAVAQYNHFIDAAPVTAGWPLIRDVTNMFVIVILLAVAFGTIIGYQKLHYKGVLGKLLLMAILVNFSKQLVGVLIDFSQVVMLTFVNAFRAAAGGNFTQALKLDKMLSLAQTSQSVATVTVGQEQNTSVADPLLVKTVIASMLAIFFLGVTIVLLIIMFIYLLARIVGLWIALIVSPLALFLTAVPSVVAGKVNALASGYWEKLGALIAGGPVMAFFIWLTLATVQGGGFGTFGTENLAGATEATAAFQSSGFANAIANIEDVATFFISCIMLLMGVDTAVGMTSSLGSAQLTGLVGKVRSTGIRGAKFAAYGGLAALGGAAVGVSAYAAKKGGGAIERRLDLAGKVGRGIQSAGLAFGSTGIAAAGAKLAQTRVRERKEREGQISKALVGLAPDQRLDQLERMATRTFRDPAGARAANLALARNAVTFEGGMAIGSRFEEEGKKLGLQGDALSAYRDEKTNEYIGTRLEELRKTAAAEGDEDGVKFVADKRKDNPAWMVGDVRDTVAKIAEKTAAIDITKNFPAASLANPEVVDGILRGSDLLNANGEINEGGQWAEKLLKPNGMAAKAIRARHAALLAAATASGMTVQQLLASDEKNETKNKQRRQELGVEGGRLVRQRDGGYAYVSSAAYARGSGEAAGAADARPVRFESEVAAGRRRMEEARAGLAAARSGGADESVIRAGEADLQAARLATLRAGATMGEVYATDRKGSFGNEAAREEFTADIREAQAAGAPHFDAYQTIDGFSLTQNANAFSETRATFVENVDVNKLAHAAALANSRAKTSKTAEDRQVLRNTGNLARAIDIQGQQVQDRLGREIGKRPDAKIERGKLIQSAIEAAKAHEASRGDTARQGDAEKQLRDALAGAGLGTDAMSMDDAKSLLKQQQVQRDEILGTYKKYASSQTGEAVKRVMGAAAAGAAGAAGGVAETAREARRVASENFTPTGRKARRMREEASGSRASAAPEVEPERPGGAPRRRADYRNPAPTPRPPRPRDTRPPDASEIPDLDVPGGSGGGLAGR